MNNLSIAIFSCDKNEELWPIFYHCINKYWPNHPKAYLLTESIKFPYIETITYPYDLEKWTTRISKSLNEIKEDYILFICDDCFLDNYVEEEKLKTCINLLESNKNAACINLELSFEDIDQDTEYEGIKKKTKDSPYALSFLCGIWNRKILIDLLSKKECNPWLLESEQNLSYYDFYQVSNKKVISWFRDGPIQFAACYRGKWSKEIIPFLQKENLSVDLSKKGFWD